MVWVVVGGGRGFVFTSPLRTIVYVWTCCSERDDSNWSLLLLEASKYLLRHLFASTFVYKTVSSTQVVVSHLIRRPLNLRPVSICENDVQFFLFDNPKQSFILDLKILAPYVWMSLMRNEKDLIPTMQRILDYSKINSNHLQKNQFSGQKRCNFVDAFLKVNVGENAAYKWIYTKIFPSKKCTFF